MVGSGEESPCATDLTTPEELARKALRRSLALALQNVGFDSAAPEAMESFVTMTETCKTKFIWSHSLAALLTARHRP